MTESTPDPTAAPVAAEPAIAPSIAPEPVVPDVPEPIEPTAPGAWVAPMSTDLKEADRGER